ncbi:glycogen debranching N-terminal domain-containing protein [Streptomyces sp. NBC_01190]|uniref:glycogen debranching N-terminal domain-containing protein n=1 Tax=Streptomyces sp. NBC_01190 TaxID=2903767 RepID=UPI003868D60E
MVAHDALVCLAAPAFSVSAPHGQLRGTGLEGCYRNGRRILARCELTVAGAEPVVVQARTLGAERVRFVAVVRTAADRGPDPAVTVERVRSAEGAERITLANAGPVVVRLSVEVALGTDLADLADIAAGRPGQRLVAGVSGSGLRWTRGPHAVSVTARPAPDTVLASAGMLRWDLELPPGEARTVELITEMTETVAVGGGGPHMEAADRPPALWPDALLEADDPRAAALLAASLGDLQALLLRDPGNPADLHLAAGAPWRIGLAPADALWAARMLLPLGTRLAAGTLRSLARVQQAATGRLPGVLRDAGAHLPPLSSGVEATLLFVTVLEEARRWGLPEREVEALLPAAERCLAWLRAATSTGAAAGAGAGFVGDGAPGGTVRAEVQAYAHRAALQGAELLDAFARPGAGEWREYAAELRARFRAGFWIEGPGGGRPALAVTAEGRRVPLASSALAHLLDTGLLGRGDFAPGLLDRAQTERLGRLLTAPDLDSGWGLRTLSAKAPGFSPFGHRGGAVRVHETAVAAFGLAAAGREKEASALVMDVLEAAGTFGMRLPEMYGGEQRLPGGAPCPHPLACRPAAVAAAGAVHLLMSLAGVRPDVPGGVVAVRPPLGAPLGALRLSGLRVAGEPFGVRVSRLGTGMVEEAAAGLLLGA